MAFRGAEDFSADLGTATTRANLTSFAVRFRFSCALQPLIAVRKVDGVKPTTRGKATYADIEKLPEHVVGEIVAGELFVSPRPSLVHASIQTAIAMQLAAVDHGQSRARGRWRILVEPELHLGRDILVPDLAGWRIQRMPRLSKQPHTSITPDWICEVTSPSTARVDHRYKLPRYAKAGVGHAWVVMPPHRSIDVLRLSGRSWLLAESVTHNDRGIIEPFEELEFDLGRIWPDEIPSVHSPAASYVATVQPERRLRSKRR